MKKLFVVFLLTAALMLGGFGAAFAGLRADETDVVFTPVPGMAEAAEALPGLPRSSSPLAGTPQAVDDLHLELTAQVFDRMFWTMALTPGTQPDTAFRLEPKRLLSGPGPGWRGQIEANVAVGFGSTISGGSFELAHESQTFGWSRVFQDLYTRAVPGTRTTEIMDLSRFYDVWPIAFDVTMGSSYLPWDQYAQALDEDSGMGLDPQYKEPARMIRQLTEWFRFPIEGPVLAEVSIETAPDGSPVGLDLSAQDGALGLRFWQDQAGGRFYFIPDAQYTDPEAEDPEQEHWRADYSLTPHGFGLYSLPVYEDGDQFDPADLAFVMPLDPDCQVASLQADPAGERLLLLTQRAEEMRLDVLDPARAVVESSEIIPASERDEWPVLRCEEDFALVSTNERFILLEQQPDGSYRIRYGWPLTFQNGFERILDMGYGENNSRLALSADGRLAMAAPLGQHYSEGCGYALLVYDDTGLLYAGGFESSLAQPGPDRYDYQCRMVDPLPALYWE